MSENQPLGVSWSGAEEYAKDLRRKISDSEFDPDYIAVISRGGAFPGVLLAHLGPWRPIFTVGVRREGEERVVEDSPHINWPALENKRVLLVEDKLETGKSAEELKKHMEQYKAEVKLACFFASETTQIQPDYVILTTSRSISFPWERFRE